MPARVRQAGEGRGVSRRTVGEIAGMKGRQKIAMVTAYDYTMAALCEGAGIDVVLVGDSAGMVMMGHKSTVPVTMDDMCLFAGSVARARREALLVADMPFMSYQADASQAVSNAGRLVRAGADAVKLEGAMPGTVSAITGVGIPVMGHLGVLPQTAGLGEGYAVRGGAEAARAMSEDAKALAEAGAFAVTLEMVGREAAGQITRAVPVPTIGIGSGPDCDGQVLVLQDMLGMYERIRPRFVRRYAELGGAVTDAVRKYAEDVRAGRFPAPENWTDMP